MSKVGGRKVGGRRVTGREEKGRERGSGGGDGQGGWRDTLLLYLFSEHTCNYMYCKFESHPSSSFFIGKRCSGIALLFDFRRSNRSHVTES